MKFCKKKKTFIYFLYYQIESDEKYLNNSRNDIDYDDEQLQDSFEHFLQCLKKLKFFYVDIWNPKSTKLLGSSVKNENFSEQDSIGTEAKPRIKYELETVSIVPKKQAKKSLIWEKGPQTNYRFFKHIIRELKIDFQR